MRLLGRCCFQSAGELQKLRLAWAHRALAPNPRPQPKHEPDQVKMYDQAEARELCADALGCGGGWRGFFLGGGGGGGGAEGRRG